MSLLTTPPETGTSRRTLLLAFRSSAASAAVTYLFNLAILPFVLGRVGSPIYGAWATMASILAVGGLADAGIRTEIVRRVGRARGDGDADGLERSVHQGVTLLAVLAAAIVAVGVAAAPAIRAFAFPSGVPGYRTAEIDLLLRLTVAVLAAELVANGYFGVLRGVQRADVETTGVMLSVPVSALVTVVGVHLGWALWALFAGSLTVLAVTVAWSWIGTRRLAPGLRLRLVAMSGPVARGYLGLSALALLSQVSEVVDSQWDKVVLSRYVGSAAVASFQIGTTLVLQGKVLALLPLAPLLVAIAELRRRDPARVDALYALMARAAMALTAVVLSAIWVFVPAFLRLWLGPGDVPERADVAARLFTFAVVLNLLCAPLALRAFGEGWYRLTAASAATNMVVNGGTSLALTMAVGFEGALYGSIVGTAAGCALMIALMRRRLGDRWVPIPFRGLVVGLTAAVGALLLGLDRVGSWPMLLVAGGGYVLVVGLACTRAERLNVRELLSRRVPA